MDKEKLRENLIKALKDNTSLNTNIVFQPLFLDQAISQILELEGEEIKNSNIALGLISYDFESMKAKRDRYKLALENIRGLITNPNNGWSAIILLNIIEQALEKTGE